MLIVSTLQMPAQQGRSICEDSSNTWPERSRLATLMALLVPASAARQSHDDPGLSAMMSQSMASNGDTTRRCDHRWAMEVGW